MKYQNLFQVAFIGALLATTIGCNKNQDTLDSKIAAAPITPAATTLPTASTTRTINDHQYQFAGNKVSELTTDADDQATYGVISDAHGEVEKTRMVVQQFLDQKVEGIIFTGDLPNNEGLRSGEPDKNNDKTEIVDVLSAAADTGLPIFVIPGNHERKPDYQAALHTVTSKYSNVIDMTTYRVFNGDDADFVSLPGYQTLRDLGRQFIPNEGYWAQPEDIRQLATLRQGLDDPVILVTHAGGKTNTHPGPTTIDNGEEVGDELTTKIMQDAHIPFAVVGHIHEAGGLAATYNGTAVPPGDFVPQFTINFGTLQRWTYLDGKTRDFMAGSIIIKGNEAKYEIIQP